MFLICRFVKIIELAAIELVFKSTRILEILKLALTLIDGDFFIYLNFKHFALSVWSINLINLILCLRTMPCAS